MVIIKRSETRIDAVYEEKNSVFREIAARSLRCARCGKELDSDASGPLVVCGACGHKTPCMVEKSGDA